MSVIDVRAVTTRRQQRQALALPWSIEGRDPLWAPPLRKVQRELLGFAQHPFYDRAEGQCFLAFREGQPVGRVLAVVNHVHNEFHGDKLGFVGFFSSIDEPEVASRLFDAAGGWLSQRGMTAMRGPANPSINYEWGLLVDGFDKPPYFMMTHNPPYYERLWTDCGFQVSHNIYAYWGHVDMLGSLSEKHKFVDESIRERFGITLRQMNRRRFREEVEMFLDIYNDALAGTWGFVPLTAAEIDRLANELKHLIVPEIALVAEHEGRPIGVCFGLLDYNEPIRRSDGRLFPLGWWRLLRTRSRSTRMRVVSANVRPEFQNWGVGITLARGLIEPVLQFGIQEAEFSWVLESNHLSRKTLEKGGAKRYKTYRVYDRTLA